MDRTGNVQTDSGADMAENVSRGFFFYRNKKNNIIKVSENSSRSFCPTSFGIS